MDRGARWSGSVFMVAAASIGVAFAAGCSRNATRSVVATTDRSKDASMPVVSVADLAGVSETAARSQPVAEFSTPAGRVVSYSVTDTASGAVRYLTVLETAGQRRRVGESSAEEMSVRVLARGNGPVWVVQGMIREPEALHQNAHTVYLVFRLDRAFDVPLAEFADGSSFEVDQRNELSLEFRLDPAGDLEVASRGSTRVFDPDSKKLHYGTTTSMITRWNGDRFVAGPVTTKQLVAGQDWDGEQVQE